MMGVLVEGALIGAVATILMDAWAAVAKHVLKLPTANWALVGRWFGHMPKGVLLHRPISSSPPIANELLLGWVGHYLIGMLYGLAYLGIVEILFSLEPSLVSALAFGLGTLFAPWLILQPAMGAGVFATRTPNPAITRLTNISMHGVFGVSLYAAWLLLH